MPAMVERLWTMDDRKVSTSIVTNPTQASSKATQLVSMMTSICLRWMEARRKRRSGEDSLFIPAFHLHGDFHKVGAQIQPGGPGR